ncbi:unnamed protein product [Effrenium voratum]|uniref:WWE domain-containing protein n=1 Tax=Effrenium voratum TaxID=2562239 RepID=A0AA36MLQ4_9DINO|nr:unnamed protein product [Effrenium voratum]
MDNAVWLWSTSGKFRPYDEATSACIEEAYQKGLANIRVRLWRGAEQADYSIDFRKMRQVNLRDPQKWRHVKRSAKTREVPQGAPAMPASEAKDTPMALEVRWKGTRKSFHLTSQAAAESIIQSGKFHHSKRGMMGPFIYFAGSPEDCDGKANGARLVDGAVLQATVDLGQSLVIRQDMSSAAQSSLGISRWSELDRAKLQQVGCQSVYATSDFVSRDEWAVVSNSQIRDLVLKGFESRGRPLPYWQWPRWVHSLANAVNVDYIAIDRVTEGAAGRTDPAPPGVRVNSAGRPVHSDGRFMSYSEARQLGWGQAPPPSPNPWNEHQKRMGGQGVLSSRHPCCLPAHLSFQPGRRRWFFRRLGLEQVPHIHGGAGLVQVRDECRLLGLEVRMAQTPFRRAVLTQVAGAAARLDCGHEP